MNRRSLDGKRIALIMDVQGRDVVLRGIIALRQDAKQGCMLQVTVEGDDDAAVGSPVLLISEQRWKSHISSGLAYQCEYQLDLSRAAVSAA